MLEGKCESVKKRALVTSAVLNTVSKLRHSVISECDFVIFNRVITVAYKIGKFSHSTSLQAL